MDRRKSCYVAKFASTSCEYHKSKLVGVVCCSLHPDFGGPGGDSHRILSSNVCSENWFFKNTKHFPGFFLQFFWPPEKPFAKIRF
jgi:hypothetical protein